MLIARHELDLAACEQGCRGSATQKQIYKLSGHFQVGFLQTASLSSSRWLPCGAAPDLAAVGLL